MQVCDFPNSNAKTEVGKGLFNISSKFSFLELCPDIKHLCSSYHLPFITFYFKTQHMHKHT